MNTLKQTAASGGQTSTTLYVERSASGGRYTHLVEGVDRIVNRIDRVSADYFPVGAAFSAQSRILNVEKSPLVGEWRVNVRKVAMLARLQEGWDYPDSQPMDREAETHYLEWVAGVPDDRMDDAEPMLTDEGHIRLEWRSAGYKQIVEIGPNSLYLASLAPDRSHNVSEELDHYDAKALDQFFFRGVLPQ